MQLTSARNVQFGFACKVPLTRFNFLANFQCWGINLNSSCIIPILSICRGRQESASGPGYSNKNVDTEQIRGPLPPHDGSWYLIECNCGNCFLVAVHKKPVPGCNQCRHINIITGVSGYQCLGVFRSCPGGGRCGLRLQSDEWCSDGVKTVQQCMVSPGEGSYASFVPSLFTMDFITNVCWGVIWMSPYLGPRLATSDPGYLFCGVLPSSDTTQASCRSQEPRPSGRVSQISQPSPFSPVLVLVLGESRQSFSSSFSHTTPFNM